MNKLRRIFNPTKEEKIEDYERIIQIHKEHIDECCTCKYYNPPPADLPGYITDYGNCELDMYFFAVKVCGLRGSRCDCYEENIEFVEHFTELIEQLKGE